MDLVIVRHARPERDERVAGAGTADPPLSAHGRRQAEATAAFLAGERIDHVVSSPMRRARETAAPLAGVLGIDVELVDGLAEVDRHEARYVPAEELALDDAIVQSFLADRFAMFAAFGGFPAFRDGVVAAMEHVIATNRGRRVAVFCHGMVMGAYLTSLVGHDDPFVLQPDYCGIVRVQAASNGIRTVRSANETAHVRGLVGD